MIWIQRTLAITLLLVSLVTIAPPVHAQSRSESQPTPSGPGRPPNRRGGGDRGNCYALKTQANQQLTALVPNDGETRSLTATPTLWFYVPYASTPDVSTTIPISVRFSLRDARGRRALFDGIPFEPIVIPLSGTPGIIGIRLPKALEPEKEYRWYLTVICDATEDGPSVDGWLRLIQPSADLLRQLKQASIEERLVLYKNANIWSDQLTLLAEKRDLPSQGEEWTKLLQEVGLAELAHEAIAPCCVLK
jgi:hypothetical protein